MINLSDYLPWEFFDEPTTNEHLLEDEWFNELKTKYKEHRAEILPKNKWQPLIDEWMQKHKNPNTWFVLHVKTNVNADLYRAALKSKGFVWKEVENKYCDTPIYLETPSSGLNVDQSAILQTVRDMENRDGMLYYRNIPAPVIDQLYKEVFEERLVYPERFN